MCQLLFKHVKCKHQILAYPHEFFTTKYIILWDVDLYLRKCLTLHVGTSPMEYCKGIILAARFNSFSNL